MFLFEKLTDHQLEQLCEKGHVELIEPGPVFAEGEIATCFYVLIEGELVLSKLSGGEEIEFSRTSQRGVYSGAWQSYLGDRAPPDVHRVDARHRPRRGSSSSTPTVSGS